MADASSVEARFWQYVEKRGPDECWPWKGWRSPRGYGAMSARLGKRKKVAAHRFSYDLHNKIKLGKLCACHSCDNPSCCNPAHLFRGTHADNKRDAMLKLRHTHGETSPLSKLTESQVRRIRLLREKGRTLRSIGAAFGVDHKTVLAIVTRRTWAYVE
jgi:HNH endonuclease